MTVALSDIVVLRNLLRPLKDLQTLCKYLESFYTLGKPVASTINTLAGALYTVFSSSSDQARNEMRQACFDYLSLGGVFSSGPVSLLSGLNPRPLSLVCHFFAVAIYGVGRLLLPFPSPKQSVTIHVMPPRRNARHYEPVQHLDILEFFGSSNSEVCIAWLQACEDLFDILPVPIDSQVKLAAKHLRGGAAVWWQKIKQSRLRQRKPMIRD
ncbi:hypothetical protein ACS0TY_027715 [Phlomoides rotata]